MLQTWVVDKVTFVHETCLIMHFYFLLIKSRTEVSGFVSNFQVACFVSLQILLLFICAFTFTLFSCSELVMHTFLTPSINLEKCLPISLLPSTSDSYTFLVNRSPLIRSTCPDTSKPSKPLSYSSFISRQAITTSIHHSHSAHTS